MVATIQIQRLTAEEFSAVSAQVIERGTDTERLLLYNMTAMLRGFQMAQCRAEAAEKAEGELSTLVLKLQHIVQELPAKATAKDLKAAMKLVKEELAKVEGMDGDGN